MSLRTIYRAVLLLAMVLTPLLSMAKGGERSCDIVADSLFRMDFRWDSNIIDHDYRNNRSVFRQLDATIKSLDEKSIDSIVIITKASPEGVLEHNIALARRRANAMRKYMVDNYPRLTHTLRVRSDGESWGELRSCVVGDKVMSEHEKQRVLNILDNKNISVGTRKWRLERDPRYRYLYRTYYPILRNSTILVIYVDGEPVMPISLNTPPQPTMMLRRTTLAPLGKALPVEEVEEVVPTKRDTVLFALKTNMLYDALTVLNAELEVPISRHFSLAVEYLFPWWERNNKYCLEYLELGFEGRYWFRNNVHKADRLGGHFLGLYGMSAMYDIQNDYDPAYQGELWSTGLTYGYAMRVGKQKRISLEFSLSVGYLSTGYRNYFPADDYSELYINKLNIGRLRYFGPTKLKVSLVVPINIGYNKRGGSR